MSSSEVGGTNQPAWRKATFCQSGECVEVAQRDGRILLRDSKEPAGSVLHYTADEWRAFVSGIKAGEFDDFGQKTAWDRHRAQVPGLFFG